MVKVAFQISHVVKHMSAVVNQEANLPGSIPRHHLVIIDHFPVILTHGANAGLQAEAGREVTAIPWPTGLAAVKHALVVGHDATVPERGDKTLRFSLGAIGPIGEAAVNTGIVEVGDDLACLDTPVIKETGFGHDTHQPGRCIGGIHAAPAAAVEVTAIKAMAGPLEVELEQVGSSVACAVHLLDRIQKLATVEYLMQVVVVAESIVTEYAAEGGGQKILQLRLVSRNIRATADSQQLVHRPEIDPRNQWPGP